MKKPIKVRWLREIMSKYADGDMEIILMLPEGGDPLAKATQVKVSDFYDEDGEVKKVLVIRAE